MRWYKHTKPACAVFYMRLLPCTAFKQALRQQRPDRHPSTPGHRGQHASFWCFPPPSDRPVVVPNYAIHPFDNRAARLYSRTVPDIRKAPLPGSSSAA